MSIQEMVNEWILTGDFIFALDSWLDAFERAMPEKRAEAILLEPHYKFEDIKDARYPYYNACGFLA